MLVKSKPKLELDLMWKQQDMIRRNHEIFAINTVKRALDKQFAEVMAYVTTTNNVTHIPDHIMNEEHLKNAFQMIYTNVGVSIARTSFNKTNDMFTKLQRADIERTWFSTFQRFALEEAGVKIRNISENILQAIRKVLERAIFDRLSIPEIAKALREAWPEISRKRSIVIARTETGTAANLGSLEGAMSTGFEMKKVWLSTRDNKTRDTHLMVDGQKVPIKGNFIVGGQAANFPLDPKLSAAERINCRCAIFYEVV